jgi:hypothetical protein
VQSELPNPINLEAATASVREEDVAENVSCGTDAAGRLSAIDAVTDAVIEH